MLGSTLDRLRGGWLGQTFAIRLMICIGVAAATTEVLPLQRSYWVVLTVAIVLKPDYGSVFARALQRGIGTIVGAVLGAVILAMVPYGPLLLIPMAVLAAGLPFGRSRNFGLMATFLTPLVVVLIDLLTPTGWRLAGERLVDTLLGCAIVLLIGYAPWPMSWHSHLPRQFAATLRDICRYTEEALVTSWVPAAGPLAGNPDGPRAADGAPRAIGPQPTGSAQAANVPGPARRSLLRRKASRALADLRAEYQRAMSEPPAVSRRASAWWPAIVGLEEVIDAVTATAVEISRGAPAPAPDAVHQLTAVLDAVADAIDAGVPPPRAASCPPTRRSSRSSTPPGRCWSCSHRGHSRPSRTPRSPDGPGRASPFEERRGAWPGLHLSFRKNYGRCSRTSRESRIASPMRLNATTVTNRMIAGGYTSHQ